MKFLEKDLETIIYENRDAMYGRGLFICDHEIMLRQFNLLDYGTADLIGIKFIGRDIQRRKVIYVTVYELKQEVVDASTLLQAYRYVEGIKHMIRNHYNLKNTRISYSVCLIGASVQKKGDFVLAMNNIPSACIFTYDYKFDGIHFTHEHGYSITKATLPKLNRQRLIEIADKSYHANLFKF